MNNVVLIGRLCDEPEVKTTSGGVAVCTFRLAVQRRFANSQGVREADFLNVVAWRQLAELCARYLSKGRKVAVEGSVQTRSYDAQDGSKRHVTEIVADSVEFLESRGVEGRSDQQTDTPNTTRTRNEQQRMDMPIGAAAQDDGFQDVDDDDLPF